MSIQGGIRLLGILVGLRPADLENFPIPRGWIQVHKRQGCVLWIASFPTLHTIALYGLDEIYHSQLNPHS